MNIKLITWKFSVWPLTSYIQLVISNLEIKKIHSMQHYILKIIFVEFKKYVSILKMSFFPTMISISLSCLINAHPRKWAHLLHLKGYHPPLYRDPVFMTSFDFDCFVWLAQNIVAGLNQCHCIPEVLLWRKKIVLTNILRSCKF